MVNRVAAASAPGMEKLNSQLRLDVAKGLIARSQAYANIRIILLIRRNYLSASFAGRPHKHCLHSKKMRINTLILYHKALLIPGHLSTMVLHLLWKWKECCHSFFRYSVVVSAFLLMGWHKISSLF